MFVLEVTRSRRVVVGRVRRVWMPGPSAGSSGNVGSVWGRVRVQTNKQTNVFVKPRTSPFTGGHSSHALRLGPLGGARRTQMRSSALGVLPQCPRGLMLDCARHTSHCESNFGSFCRGCPTQRSRVPSSVCRPRLVSLAVLFGGCVASGILLG